MATRVGHVSRVWDHVHWIPGEILPQFDPSHSHVAHLEAELEIMKNLEQSTQPLHRLYIANFAPKGLTEIPRSLLYTNMTPTKTPTPSETLK